MIRSDRTGYTVLDILSDVGGLQGILISVISFSLSILNHSHLDGHLVSKLFKSKSIGLVASKTESIKEFCIRFQRIRGRIQMELCESCIPFLLINKSMMTYRNEFL